MIRKFCFLSAFSQYDIIFPEFESISLSLSFFSSLFQTSLSGLLQLLAFLTKSCWTSAFLTLFFRCGPFFCVCPWYVPLLYMIILCLSSKSSLYRHIDLFQCFLNFLPEINYDCAVKKSCLRTFHFYLLYLPIDTFNIFSKVSDTAFLKLWGIFQSC